MQSNRPRMSPIGFRNGHNRDTLGPQPANLLKLVTVMPSIGSFGKMVGLPRNSGVPNTENRIGKA